MTPVEIQFEIRRRGYSQRSLAREWGYDEMSISRCINKKPRAVTAPLVDRISRLIEADPKAVFPEYFEARKRKPRRPKAA